MFRFYLIELLYTRVEVSHQRNIIQLHSYIEYFSRNSSPRALFYRLQFRRSTMENFHRETKREREKERKRERARRHASNVWNALYVFVNVLNARTKGQVSQLKASNFHLFESDLLKTERPSARATVSEGCNFRPTMGTGAKLTPARARVKSRPIRGQNLSPIEVSLIFYR